MSEYTYKDVIIDPNDPRVEIGKKYYFALGAQACIDYANRGCRLNTLDEIASEEYSPFITDEKDYPFIIRKKEKSYWERQAEWVEKEKPEEAEYIPFDLSKEEDRDALRGKWVRDSRWGHEWMVEGFFIDEATGAGYKAKLSRKKAGFNGEQLLERYVFLNGSPVGKPANGQQME